MVRRFLRAYLGSPGAPVPFGGRAGQIAQLNEWLADTASPANLLITAPAGRGKTALLVRWVSQVGPTWPVAFVPISIRYETNRAGTFYQALAARLAEILEQELPLAPTDAAAFYRDKVIEYLDLFEADNRRCLIVIDGLDEAAGWQVDTSVLPLDPAPGLRIVASARLLAGDDGPADWRRRLGWDLRGRPCQTMEIPLLDRDGIGDIAARTGFSWAPSAARADVLAQLLRLTMGEPLLLELYLSALLAQDGQRKALHPEALRTLKPGFEGFFKTWWELQRRAWREAGIAVDEQAIDAILATLSCALGPLKLAELGHLIHTIHGIETIVSADTLDPIRRFVIGDPTRLGYSLSHPKLRDYFREERFANGRVIADTRAGFIAWGRETVRALNAKALAPSSTPEYLLNHYVQHLEQEQVPAELFLELADAGWRAAWEAQDGGDQGFASDLRAVWRALKRAADGPTPHPATPALVAGQVRCALFLSSIWSIDRLPLSLVRTGVEKGLIGPRQVVHFADTLRDPRARIEVLAGLAPLLPESQRSPALAHAVETTEAIRDDKDRAETLGGLAPHLSGELLAEALAVARAIPDGQSRALALGALVLRLPESARTVPLAEVLAAIQTISDKESLARTLVMLAPHLPEELLARALEHAETLGKELPDALRLAVFTARLPEGAASLEQAARTAKNEPAALRAMAALVPGLTEQLLAESFDAMRKISEAAGALAGSLPNPSEDLQDLLALRLEFARSIGDAGIRGRALADLAPLFPVDQRMRLLAEAFEASRTVEDGRSRAAAFTALAPDLPEDLRGQAIAEAIEAARAILNERLRAEALAALAPHLPPDLIAAALTAARAIRPEDGRSRVLSILAPHLSPALLPEALSAARAVGDEAACALALAALIPYHPDAERTETFAHALRVLRAVPIAWDRARPLIALAPHLPDALLIEAVETARAIPGDVSRARALAALAPRLARSQHHQALAEALAVAQGIENEELRLEALAALAPHLSGALFAEAFEAVRMITGTWNRGRALARLAPHLPEEWLAESLQIAREIGGGWGRTMALTALGHRLPPDERARTFSEALAAAREVEDERSRGLALSELGPTLPEAERAAVFAEALAAARAIPADDGRSRTEVLASLAPHLPEELVAGALANAQEIDDDRSRAEALAILAPRLPDHLVAGAVEAARTVGDSWGRAMALGALAARLPEAGGVEVLEEAARTIADANDRVRALVALIPRLPGTLRARALAQAFETARALGGERSRAQALGSLIPHLQNSDRWTAVALLLETGSHAYRGLLLEQLGGAAHTLAELGGPIAIGEVCRAIRQATTWWP